MIVVMDRCKLGRREVKIFVAKSDQQIQVQVEIAKSAPAHLLYATSFKLEAMGSTYLIIFRNDSGPVRAVSISRQNISDNLAGFRKFVEDLGMVDTSHSFSARGRADEFEIYPADMMNVSRRGDESEFYFSTYSLHDLAVGRGKTPRSIMAYPILMVRCPTPMMQLLMVELLASYAQ